MEGDIRWAHRLRPAGPTVVAVLLVVVLIGAALVTSLVTDSIKIPHNDTWAYTKDATTFFHSGRFRLQGFGQMFLLGQLVSAVPVMAVLGARPAALNVYGAIAAATYLLVAYRIARAVVGHRRAIVVVVVISVFPGFGLLATTFMTDLPSVAAALACIALGVRAIRRAGMGWWAAALLTGLFAFTIREQAGLALVAIGVTVAVAPRLTRRFKLAAVAGTVVTIVIALLLERVRRHLPGADVPPYGLSTISLQHLRSALPALFDLGLALSPLAVWNLVTLPLRLWLAPGRLVGWALGIAAAVHLLSIAPHVTIGVYLDENGPYLGGSIGSGSPIVGPHFWDVVQAVAVAGGVLVAGELGAALFTSPGRLVRLARSPLRTALAAYAALTILAIVALAAAGEPQYDRYIIPLLVPLAVLLLHRKRVPALVRIPSIAIAGVALGFVGLLSWTLTVSGDVRDAALWSTAEKLVKQGVSAQQINAGLNWDGMHSPVPADKKRRDQLRRPYQYRGAEWAAMFPQMSDCWVVSTSGLPLLRFGQLVSQRDAHPYGLQLRTVHMYVYQRQGCRGAVKPLRTAP